MIVVRTIDDLRTKLVNEISVGLVPTMGAFHEGHLSLMRQAREACQVVVTSIFVNPTQFGPKEDFEKYPRDEAADLSLAEAAGVDIAFCPSATEIYPRKTTVVSVEGVTDLWEGSLRPGHFNGVSTVVLKLFNIVQPNVSYFGLKDYQQCTVIKRMVEDLDIPIDLRFCETVRAPDGLAMSSRNRYLSDASRQIAPRLFQELTSTSRKLRLADPDVVDVLERSKRELESFGFSVDYFALVDSNTLERLSVLNDACRLIAAAKLEGTRLLDNVAV